MNLIPTAYYLFGAFVIARFFKECLETINKTGEDELRRREEQETKISNMKNKVESDDLPLKSSDLPLTRLLILVWVIAGFFTPYKYSFISVFIFSIFFQPFRDNIPASHAYMFFRFIKFASIIHIAGIIYLYFFVDNKL